MVASAWKRGQKQLAVQRPSFQLAADLSGVVEGRSEVPQQDPSGLRGVEPLLE